MLKVAYHPSYAHSLPEGHRFPMLKYELIPEQLIYEGTLNEENFFEPGFATENDILKVHDSEYWYQLKNLSLSLKDQRRIGFPLSKALIDREIRIAQGTIDASLNAIKFGVSFNIAGGTHHAGSSWGEGFCLLNDQAIAAQFLIDNELCKKVLIVDLDVHQGNGTAQIFSGKDNVFTFSMHGADNFPFRKEKSDLDIPLKNGTDDSTYLKLLTSALPDLFEFFKPDFVFYLAGVDVLETDKLGKLAMTIEGCKRRDEFVFNTCINYGVPLQVSMGGGYSESIKVIVEAHCNTYRLANQLFF